jgi:Putative DnaT-like ssDNA binding protein
MAITIDASIGAQSTNSYLTVVRSNALAETLPHMGEWLSDASINKPQLLVYATRLIDLNFIPLGYKASSSQALMWPQGGLYYVGTTTAIPTSIIPECVEYATLEWAWALHENPDPYDDIAGSIRTLNTPSYRIEFDRTKAPSIPVAVGKLLSAYSINRISNTFHRVIRV